MSGPLGSQQWMYSTGFYPYEIGQSLRFNDDDSAYLNRTPASAGNRKTWTWSGWVKRTDTSTAAKVLFQAGTSGYIWFLYSQNQLYLQQNPSSTIELRTTQVFRDSGAWGHLVLAVDTTQSTASDRVKLYWNGVQITSFSTATYPSQNLDTFFNATDTHYIGSNPAVSNLYDGYMAEVNLIDGQALDATAFGKFKSGVWIPKSYSGTYGTNGFYLDFGNAGSLGADVSGNSNNWTPNNLAATDQMLDSPTNNFATLNSLAASGTFSEGNLKFIGPSNWTGAPSTVKIPNEGKWYAEFLQQTNGLNNTLNDAYGTVGLSSLYSGDPSFTSFQNNSYIFTDTSNVVDFGSSTVKSLGSGGDVIGVSIDMLTGSASIFRNGTLLDSTTISDTTDLNFVYIDYNANYGQFIANFGQDSSFAGNKTRQGYTDARGIGDFYYAPPAGYLALCTANLPDPAIDPAQDDVPADYFNTVLYTGDGSTQSITGVGFQPDFTWFKARSSAYDHQVVDAIRGAGNVIYTNLTASEGTLNTVSSFDSDGFTVDGNTYAGTNGNGTTFAAWNWLAGNGTTSNTDGTITSTVSANQKAGFSIVTWSGDNGVGTIGHGLTEPPEIIIRKSRTTAVNWVVTGLALGSQKYMYLNLTNAAATWTPITDPTATVFNGWGTDSNTPSMVAYCFHSVEGYSKFGSYTGNGSNDGPFVYTGFRPAFVMIKRTDSTLSANWYMYDSSRDTYNQGSKTIEANLSAAENATKTTYYIDFLSNGFKIRANVEGTNDTTSSAYIYMAFAEMPFKYSLGR